ncbi:MAG: RNA polymerase sigma factor [Clostridia bacterium]|nr:RNA polymerase sigma factor [Clostridia bacterium]
MWSFIEFLDGITPPLTRYCAAVAGTADGEDAAQEALIRTWQHRDRIPNEKAAAVFAYRTAYRLCVDALRRRKREQAALETCRDTTEPEQQLSDRMKAALLTLSPADRAVVYSRAVEEAAYREIAIRFGKTEAWARKRYSLALRKLAALLDEGGNENGKGTV